MHESLKVKVLKAGILQRDLAKMVGRPESWMSKVLNGHVIPRRPDRKAIAAALKCSMKSLWPEMTGKP